MLEQKWFYSQFDVYFVYQVYRVDLEYFVQEM